MLPITAGLIPFGLVMGTVASNAGLSLTQIMSMNVFVFAGASQLAAIDLMTQNISILIVIVTGIVINLRFMLYSASLSVVVKESRFLTKLFVAYCLTDQTYAILMANKTKDQTKADTVMFYIGSSLSMIIAWQFAVFAGFIFGNLAPSSLALEFAVPLSFIALTVPSLKNAKYVYVALTSAVLSVILKDLPFNGGLLASAFIAIILGAILTRKKRSIDE
jgi:4-azaleucine resistance transporter AzlC